MTMNKADEVNHTLQLEAVYYSAPIPRSFATLTALGFVFDRVHFPGVHLPTENFDIKEWQKEIDRISELNLRDPGTRELLWTMRFVAHAKTLEGFCVFDRATDDPLGDDVPQQLARNIFELIHGPPSNDWVPMLNSWHSKAVPGSDEHMTYPGTFHYPGLALMRAAEMGFPLLNDIEGLPIPGATETDFANNAPSLAAFLALQTIMVVLPELPLLRPEDLVEFRDENREPLRAFRRAMLRYAGDWRGKLDQATQKDIEESATFLIQTEIVPVLDELRQSMNQPARRWYERAIDLMRVAPSVTAACFTMGPHAAVAKALTSFAPQFFEELSAQGDKKEALKRSGLYYLLRLEAKTGS